MVRIKMSESIDTLPKPKRGGYRGGSRKGIPNKVTANAREAIAALLDTKFTKDRVGRWLDMIEQDDRPGYGPLACLRALTDLMEFHVPKLARTTVSGDDGSPLEIVVSWQGINPNATPLDVARKVGQSHITPAVEAVIESSVQRIKESGST